MKLFYPNGLKTWGKNPEFWLKYIYVNCEGQSSFEENPSNNYIEQIKAPPPLRSEKFDHYVSIGRPSYCPTHNRKRWHFLLRAYFMVKLRLEKNPLFVKFLYRKPEPDKRAKFVRKAWVEGSFAPCHFQDENCIVICFLDCSCCRQKSFSRQKFIFFSGRLESPWCGLSRQENAS
jgi:hypothetical protein